MQYIITSLILKWNFVVIVEKLRKFVGQKWRTKLFLVFPNKYTTHNSRKKTGHCREINSLVHCSSSLDIAVYQHFDKILLLF